MAVNHVNFANGEELIDLRQDTVSEDTLLQGATAHNSKGEKIVGRMIPEGGFSVQADHAENDPLSPAYIKNRLAYDGRLTSHFSSDDTPNPPKFTDSLLGYNWFKVSDLIPKGDELFGATFTASGISSGNLSLTPKPENKVIDTNDFVCLVFDLGGGTQFAYIITYNAGTFTKQFPVNVGGGQIVEMPITVTIPETGVYMAWVSSSLSSGVTVDIEYGELKKIDPKFLPDNIGGGIRVVEVFADEDASLIQLSDEQNDEMFELVQRSEPFVLKLSVELSGEKLSMLFQHAGVGYFYAMMMNFPCYAVYDAENKTITTQINLSPLASSSTYSLRGGTQETTFAEFIEMMIASARERGLLKGAE